VLGYKIARFGRLATDWSVEEMTLYRILLNVGLSLLPNKKKSNKHNFNRIIVHVLKILVFFSPNCGLIVSVLTTTAGSNQRLKIGIFVSRLMTQQ
jgi:hypothetical protein